MFITDLFTFYLEIRYRAKNPKISAINGEIKRRFGMKIATNKALKSS
jgi:hypothetical protein